MNSRGRVAAQFGNDYELQSCRFDASINKQQVTLVMRLILLIGFTCLIAATMDQVEAGVLMRVCDTREIKTVTNRVCMLYKRTKNSDLKRDKDGNIRVARGAKGEYSPAKLASDCCKIGCPPHIFALNC